MTARTSRRALFGGAGSLMLLAAAAAGNDKAQELDGELLSLCADYQSAEAAWRAHSKVYAKIRTTHPNYEALSARDDELQELAASYLPDIAALPARTPEGLRAKAAAVYAFYEQTDPPDDGAADVVAWSLVCDMVGRSAA